MPDDLPVFDEDLYSAEPAPDHVQLAPPPPRTPTPEPLIPNILPAGQVHLLSGASGVGKTVLYLQLLRTAFTGIAFLGLQLRRPRFVGVIASDRPGDDHLRWINLLEIASSNLAFYSLVDDKALNYRKLHSYLDEHVKANGRFELFEYAIDRLLSSAGLRSLPHDSLIVLDPYAVFMGSNLNDYARVFTHMFALNQWCYAFGCTILGIAHAGKQSKDPRQQYARPQDRILGSTAQTSCAGTTLHLAPPTETRRSHYELCLVPHHAESTSVSLSRAQDGTFQPAPGATPSARELRSTTGAQQLLALFPPDEPITTADLLVKAMATFQRSRPTILSWLKQGADLHLFQPIRRGVWVISKAAVN